MTVFDQRGQVIKGVQLNAGGKFEPMTEDIDPSLAVKLCKALGITSISSKGDGWITAKVPCKMDTCNKSLILRDVNTYYTLDTVKVGGAVDTELIITDI